MISKFQMFEKVTRFSSGIGQRINGRLHEVSACRVTLKRKMVSDEFRILNNHDCLVYKNKSNEEIIRMFTTKEDSKGLGNMVGTRTNNEKISEVTITGRHESQYLAGTQIKGNRNIMNFNKSEKAENFAKENSDSITKVLNKNNDIYIEIEMKKIND